jgi:pimeloyl-ACP methyl ester carboxylesterase
VKRRKLLFGICGIVLLGMGLFLFRLEPYRPHTVIASAEGCRMRVDIVEPAYGEAQGFVVLLHGLSATKRIMFYLAQGFANQNLRVFVPDLPGHGRTPGPFSPARVEACTEALLQELIERRAILPQKTILAGHSMGGALALRLALRVPVAGVIAISPAPMSTQHGVSPELLLFRDPKPLPANSLVISGAWEVASMLESAADLVHSGGDGMSEYVVIPRATHVSLLFDTAAAFHDRRWASRVLHVDNSARLPRKFQLYGSMIVLAGLILLAAPFLAETTASSREMAAPDEPPAGKPIVSLLQVCLVSALAVVALRAGVPLRFLHIFQGDYLASFFLLAGLGLFAWNWRLAAKLCKLPLRPIFSAVLAAIALLLLFGGWLDLTFYEAWLTAPRWLRLPGVFLALLPWHLAEESLLGGRNFLGGWPRTALGLSFRALAWLALTGGLFFLHSGEILLVLLAVYFALFFVLQRLAMDVVRRETRSPASAAVFGAILLAGFVLVIFPIT